jgi:electron transfer flavoprotein beta subunit
LPLKNIVVCVKSVPDPRCSASLDPETKRLCRTGAPPVINPLDRHALQAALGIKSRHGGKVLVISMGPPQARDNLVEALALGADEAIHLCDMAFAGADTLATAHTLASAIRRIGDVDLLLCGSHSSDGSSSQVGPQLAEALDIAHVVQACLIELQERRVLVHSILDSQRLTVSANLPVLITVTKAINTPRRVSLFGIVAARQKPVHTWTLADLGLSPSETGAAASPTCIADIIPVKYARMGERLNGSSEEMVEVLVNRLRGLGALKLIARC